MPTQNRPHPPYQWNGIPEGLLEKLQETGSSLAAAILQDIIGQVEQQQSLICAAYRGNGHTPTYTLVTSAGWPGEGAAPTFHHGREPSVDGSLSESFMVDDPRGESLYAVLGGPQSTQLLLQHHNRVR